jgi:hypothetical protein
VVEHINSFYFIILKALRPTEKNCGTLNIFSTNFVQNDFHPGKNI